jgi:hypothetical protein
MFKRNVLATIALLAAANALDAAVITIDATARGWINGIGQNNGQTASNNYFAGLIPGPTEFRNFFLFDVPVLTGPVVSARLLLQTAAFVSSDASETYGVTSIPAAFDFADLGTGTPYGSRSYTEADDLQVTEIVLNDDALATILASAPFRLGGRITTIDGLTTQQTVFGGTGPPTSFYLARLEITTTDAADQAVSNLITELFNPAFGLSRTEINMLRICLEITLPCKDVWAYTGVGE